MIVTVSWRASKEAGAARVAEEELTTFVATLPGDAIIWVNGKLYRGFPS